LVINVYCFGSALSESLVKNDKNHCNIKKYFPEIVAVYPHQRDFFTQGLIYESGIIYESTGLYGKSAVVRYGLDSPVRTKANKLPSQYFGEGLALTGSELVQISYKKGVGFIYDKNTLELIDTFQYRGEGWGLAYDGVNLIMSDGSHVLRYLSKDGKRDVRKLEVTRCDKPLRDLNELEYIEDKIFANIWQSGLIAVINPENGVVTAEIDAQNIVDRYASDPAVDVLNGIAWDGDQKRLFVTGKLWPHIYEIRLDNLE
jgi:glutaminyl-peptide cyclotransferase